MVNVWFRQSKCYKGCQRSTVNGQLFPMVPVLLILIPLLSGFILFALKGENLSKNLALLSSVLTLAVSLFGLTVMNDAAYTTANREWMPSIRSNFHVELDGLGQLLCLLTA